MSLHRVLNTFYNTFFLLHLPLMLLIDLYPLYPPSIVPRFMTELRTFYVATYKDRFFTDRAPAWFWWFLVMEAGWHVPMCVWVVGQGGVGASSSSSLSKPSSASTLMHLHLLLFAMQTALTTGVCIAEYLSWPELSPSEQRSLGGLYVPYFVFALVMLVDMYTRVRTQLMTTGGPVIQKAS